MSDKPISTTDRMIVQASRYLKNNDVCFVGIGIPSAAANLARATHAKDVVLIYESGTIGTKPQALPLSIGDGELAETADFIVSAPEVFRYWLQGERITVGFLGAAQIDRYANINTTYIGGSYDHPKIRLPGAGGAPEIATCAKEVFIVLQQQKKTFVEKLDFITSVGYLNGGDDRDRLGLPGKGPTKIITDLGVYEPDPKSKEITLVEIYPGVTLEEIKATISWEIKISPSLKEVKTPTNLEINTLKKIYEITKIAHQDNS